MLSHTPFLMKCIKYVNVMFFTHSYFFCRFQGGQITEQTERLCPVLPQEGRLRGHTGRLPTHPPLTIPHSPYPYPYRTCFTGFTWDYRYILPSTGFPPHFQEMAHLVKLWCSPQNPSTKAGSHWPLTLSTLA